MAITQELCNSFKLELFQEGHDFDNDTFKLALYTSAATLDKTTTAYAATNEVAATGYTAGGATATISSVGLGATDNVEVEVANVSWTLTSNFTVPARGALLYNSTNANKAVLVLDFGVDVNVSTAGGVFTARCADADTLIEAA